MSSMEDDRLLSLSIRCVTGRVLAVNVRPSQSTTMLRQEVARRLTLPPGQVGLTVQQTEIQDGLPLSSLPLRDGCIVGCFVRVGSGPLVSFETVVRGLWREMWP